MVIYFEGKYEEEDQISIPSSNRSFRYGDGLFESVFISNGQPLHLHLHVNRLKKGMRILNIDIPADWGTQFFTAIISAITEKNNYINARCRIAVWRKGTGFYFPDKNEAGLMIEAAPCQNEYYELNPAGIHLGLFEEIKKDFSIISGLKTSNALISVLATMYAKHNNFDDVIFLNHNSNIVECTASNIFIYRDRQLFTPALSDGCVEGVMRQVVIGLCKQEGIPVHETQLIVDDLLQAEELFLTNAIAGIQWIGKFRYKTYQKSFASDLIFVVNEQKNNDTLVSA